MTPGAIAAATLAVTAALLPLAGIFAPLGIAPLSGLAALACLPLVWQERYRTAIPIPISIPVLSLGLAVWAALTALWAIDIREALTGAGKQALSTIAGLVTVAAVLSLDEAGRRRIARALLIGVLAATLLLAYEYLSHRGLSAAIAALKHHPIVGNKSPLNRGGSVLFLCAITCAAGYRLGPARWPVAAALAATSIMFLGDSLSTMLAVTGAVATALLVWFSPRRGLKLLMAAVAALWIAMPVAASRIPDPHSTFQNWTWLPLSAHHRTTIWGFTGRHLAEKPLLGWGMEASRRIPGADEEIRLWRSDAEGRRINVGITESMLPLHPHNAVLQIWLELGAVGALLTAGLLIAVLTAIDRLDPGDRAGRAIAAGGLTGGLLIACVSYGIWQSWWQASLWLATAFTLSGLGRPDKPRF